MATAPVPSPCARGASSAATIPAGADRARSTNAATAPDRSWLRFRPRPQLSYIHLWRLGAPATALTRGFGDRRPRVTIGCLTNGPNFPLGRRGQTRYHGPVHEPGTRRAPAQRHT